MNRLPLLFATIVVLLLLAGDLVRRGDWCVRCGDVMKDYCRQGHPDKGGSRAPYMDSGWDDGDGGNYASAEEGEF